MDSDQGKIFVGGVSWETTDEKLKEYFQSYGDVVEAMIMKDRTTGRGRGFGFVVFADPDVADRVVQDKHSINGKLVEAKKAVPRDEHQNAVKPGGPGGATSPASSTTRTKKIFVGGLAPNVSEEEFKQYFEQFGNITDIVVMYDHATQRPRGFGFITFDSEEAVDSVLQKTFHELKDKMVEVKRAVPKDASAAARSPTAGYAGPRGPFGYGQGFAAPYAYGPARGAYPSYAAAGYGAAGYGYGYAGYGGGAPYGATPGAAAYGAGTGYAAGSGAGSYGPGRNAGWAAAPSYGGNSPGYGGNGGNMSGYGATSWGNAGGAQGSTGSGSYGGYGYGGGEGGYPPGGAAAGSYGGPPSAAGSYGGGGRSSGGGGGYNNAGGGGGYAPASGNAGGYGDGYGGYPENTWRADAYGNAAPGGTPGGGYGMGAASSSPAPEGGANGSYGGYGAASRQSQRGVTAQ
ncbi:heterogeneous nuclear ribonucleoprotein 1 isoform X2 [Selaginella moellendorffii]|uniref:heterogeneous nuclear ribonucleoprotein 1 isoform X2 n=1 Tax=Selaginella moellendorffii TaxID=88036 RepID=UPI000D1C3531|nr:heterogeneous nuclear ribonucleoprotein 1 isoform X2 [Selaginella moellendorffii]XP_024533148.1 heterogeneous nuclear ribonucleoprotein 1 isoform X2 [Selaginella moellendorffii]|eukprot:XP_024532447.1 heterogeneous nuclear ribonucleoprotein 1 isoform X2 [Selaginella moellendorffii]